MKPRFVAGNKHTSPRTQPPTTALLNSVDAARLAAMWEVARTTPQQPPTVPKPTPEK